MEWRRIHLVAVMDIADVISAERQVSEMERPVRISINISELTVANSEPVNLERVYRLNRVLPSLLTERHRVGFFRAQLDQIDMHVRMRQQHVGDYVTLEDLAPLDMKRHPRHIGDRRVRMFILMHNQPIESERAIEQLKMRVRQRRVIADQLRIHFLQHARTNYRIEIEGSDIDGDHQQAQHGQDPVANSPAANSPAASRRSLFRLDVGRSTRGIECRSHLDVLFILSEKQDRYRRIEARYLAQRQAL